MVIFDVVNQLDMYVTVGLGLVTVAGTIAGMTKTKRDDQVISRAKAVLLSIRDFSTNLNPFKGKK